MNSGSSKGKQSMGAHNNAAARSSVAERRLRPIYEWLDMGNYKKALQEADRVLKKQPKFQCCKVLKSLVLIRMGRENEAEPILDVVLNESPTDDGTLQAMTIAFRELQQPEKICLVYENAIRIEPTEELLSHLFMSYVRVGSYKKQQQAAMALYKARPKNPYYFWAVMSLVLQATAGGVDEQLAFNLSLTLAERMIEKKVKEDQIEQEQEIHLYLMVLELQQKFQEALDVLDGPLGKRLNEQTTYLNLVKSKKLSYLKKVGNWSRVKELSKEMLMEEPDQWSVYIDHLHSVFQIIGDSSAEERKLAEDFIVSLKAQNPSSRSPFLAHMEFKSRLLALLPPPPPPVSEVEVETKDQTAGRFRLESQLVDLMADYFKDFGSKPACAFDLKLFLPSLSEETKTVESFFDRTLTTVMMERGRHPTSLTAVNMHVCWLRMHRLLGLHNSPAVSVDRRCSLFNVLFEDFAKSLKLEDLNSAEAVAKSSVEYGILCGHVVWDLWVETHDDVYFWKAMACLNTVLRFCPSNYGLRFLLIKFFNHAGAVGCSQSVHDGLELKQIELDSVGYLVSRHLQTCGHFNPCSDLLDKTLKFYTGNYKEVIDYIISAYRYGSFDKIREFIKLRDRLSSSQQFASMAVEKMLMDLIMEATQHETTVRTMPSFQVDPSQDTIRWSELLDNRDFSPMPSWEPTERSVTKEQIEDSFLDDQKFLKFRSLTLRALAASVSLSEGGCPARIAASPKSADKSKMNRHTGNGTVSFVRNGSVILKAIVEEMSAHQLHVEKEKVDLTTETRKEFLSVQGPDPTTRLSVYRTNCHTELLLNLLNLVIRCYEMTAPPVPQSPERTLEAEPLTDCAVKLSNAIADCVKKMLINLRQRIDAQGTRVLHRDLVFESIINVVESCSFAAILCGVCRTMAKTSPDQSHVENSNPSQPNVSGRVRKKKTGSVAQASSVPISTAEPREDLVPFVHTVNGLISTFECGLSELLEIVNDFQKVVFLTLELTSEVFTQLELPGDDVLYETTEAGRKEKSDLCDSERREEREMDLHAEQKDVSSKLGDSYAHSFANINKLIENKLTYFNRLKI